MASQRARKLAHENFGIVSVHAHYKLVPIIFSKRNHLTFKVF
jgi:hypothetical protein